jgi:type IV secretion system protein VirB10
MLVCGTAVGYRYISGTTDEERRTKKAEAEELKKIASATPGDPKAFENRLSTQQQDAIKSRDLEERQRSANAAASSPGTSKFPDFDTAQDKAAMEKAQRDAEEKARIAAEEAKRQLAIRSSKIAAWEDGSPGTIGSASNPNSILASLLGNLGGGQTSLQASQQAALAGAAALGKAGQAASGTGSNSALAAIANMLPGAGSLQTQATPGARPVDRSALGFPGTEQIGPDKNSALTPSPASSVFTLHQGATIPAVLINSVDAELPGDLRAMVTMDIYDSISLRHVLIPKGTELRGAYNSEVAAGQERLLFGFNRMIFPNGATVWLVDSQGRSNFRGTDRSGKSGLTAKVDSRFLEIFGPSLLIGVVTNFTKPLTDWLFPVKTSNSNASQSANAGATSTTTTVRSVDPVTGDETTTTTSSSNNSNNSSSTGTGGSSSTSLNLSLNTAAGETTTTVLNDVARRILDRNQNIKPRLTLSPGEKFNLTVARDMLLPPAITVVPNTAVLAQTK